MQTALDFLSTLLLKDHSKSKGSKNEHEERDNGSKSNNNERKISARHEIIDYIAEKMSVITQVCKETKLWIHPNLRRPNFSFTYSLKFTYFCNVDIWTLKKKDFRENKKPWTVIKTVSKDKNV